MMLYEISESILATLGTEDDELTPEAEVALAALQMEFDAKAEAILQYRQGLLAEAKAIEEEEGRLFAKRQAMKNKADRLLDLLQGEMKRLGTKKIWTPTFVATRCPNPPRVADADDLDLCDESLAQFVKIIPEERKLNKSAVLAAWRDGITLPVGLSVVSGEEHLRVT